MSGTLPPPPMRLPCDVAVDELLASTANLTERPFNVDAGWDDWDDWEDRTREYDTRAFGFHSVGTADARSTVQMLKDARVGLDLFLNEASVALMVGHRDLTEFQRSHLTRIVTFIEALTGRLDRVMKHE